MPLNKKTLMKNLKTFALRLASLSNRGSRVRKDDDLVMESVNGSGVEG